MISRAKQCQSPRLMFGCGSSLGTQKEGWFATKHENNMYFWMIQTSVNRTCPAMPFPIISPAVLESTGIDTTSYPQLGLTGARKWCNHGDAELVILSIRLHFTLSFLAIVEPPKFMATKVHGHLRAKRPASLLKISSRTPLQSSGWPETTQSCMELSSVESSN